MQKARGSDTSEDVLELRKYLERLTEIKQASFWSGKSGQHVKRENVGNYIWKEA